MSQVTFSTEWLEKFTDPYAVLGLSVASDDRRVLKRYHHVAKLLHPDSLIGSGDEAIGVANQLLARLVNPAYQRLKQDKGRADTLAMLRFRVRRLTRDESIKPDFDMARKLLNQPVPQVDMFYEQAIAKLADHQYQPLNQFEPITEQLSELNLVYLRLKMGEPIMREKPMGLISTPQKVPHYTPPVSGDRDKVNYAQKHYLRAQEYAKKQNLAMATQELKDAIRIDSERSEYHALMGRIYLMQNLPGAAKSYVRRALSLNNKDPLALACAKRLGISADAPNQGKPTRQEPKPKSGGLFGNFFASDRRR
ncbi:MAG TPA: molecular chaperone DnaJ [Elainellaceae cyanobacterium]